MIHIVVQQELVRPGEGQGTGALLPDVILVEHDSFEQSTFALIPEIVLGMAVGGAAGVLDDDMRHLIYDLNFLTRLTVLQGVGHEVPSAGFVQ